MIHEHLQNPQSENERDILHNLLQTSTSDGETLPVADAKAESLIFLFTASVTLSAIICPFVNYITSNPTIQAALVAEIEGFESAGALSSPVASFAETSRVPYFMACLQETLRLSPPTPVALTRKVGMEGLCLSARQKGREGKVYYLPERTEIGANPYIINRDTSIFGNDANEFRPERWLKADADQVKSMNKALFTWGYGIRDCTGKGIAKLVLQKLCLQVSTKNGSFNSLCI
ncbi:hypothetical protein MMC25_008115 [Agyrium rufum]|nr:hypothetical protein [Agyrium rufum]